jgi:hypothetical protein
MLNNNEIFCIKKKLELTDPSMARIGEDLIRILVQRGFIKYSDLSDQSREKLKEREELRAELRKIESQMDGEAGFNQF